MKNLLAIALLIFSVSAFAEESNLPKYEFSDTRLYVCSLEWPGTYFKFYPAYFDLRDSPVFYKNQSGLDKDKLPLTPMSQDFQKTTFYSNDENDLYIWELSWVSSRKGLIVAFSVKRWPADDTTQQSIGYCELTPDILFN